MEDAFIYWIDDPVITREIENYNRQPPAILSGKANNSNSRLYG